jgi:hypothetical protein
VNEEREAVIGYLRSTLIPYTCGEAEEHWNDCLSTIIDDIERGKHRQYARGEL